jgi:hypothetical protein
MSRKMRKMRNQKLRAMSAKLTHNCLQCRQARTKCDKTAPSCRRCKRMGLTCTGGMGPPPRRGRPRGSTARGSSANQKKRVRDGAGSVSHKRSKGLSHASARVRVNDSIGKGMTPCRQLQLAMLSVIVDATSAGESGESSTGAASSTNPGMAWTTERRALLHQAISAHIVNWVWTSLMRGSLYLLDEVIHLCKSCGLPFQLVDDVFRAHHRPSSPPLWQTMPYAKCLQHCPAEHVRAWQSDPGFVLAFSTFYGRRFYVSSDKMQVFMSASRANALWAENRQNIMSCFVETVPEVVETESWLITHPAHTKRVFSTLPDGGKSSSHHAVDGIGAKAISENSAPPTTGAVPTLESAGYTSPLIIVDVHNHRYSSVAHVTMYNSVCGRYRTEVFRLCPAVALDAAAAAAAAVAAADLPSSSSSSSITASSSSRSLVPVEAAVRTKEKASEFCRQHGFVPQTSMMLTSEVNSFGASRYDKVFGNKGAVEAIAGEARLLGDSGPSALQNHNSELSAQHPDSSEVTTQNLWEMYVHDFAEFGQLYRYSE